MRKEIIGNATLYLGDCLEVLPTLEKVDAVITDPPYGVLDEDWDDMTERQLSAFTMSWLGCVARLSSEAIFFFGQRTRHVINPLLYMVYPVVRQIVWNKGGGSVADDGLFYSYESAYYCHDIKSWEVCEPKALEVAKLIRQAREVAGLSRGGVDMVVRGKKTGLCYRWEEAACLPTAEQAEALKRILSLDESFDAALAEAHENRDRVVSLARDKTKQNAAKRCDVLTYSVPARKAHPTEKPSGLMADLVDVATVKDQLVLDPFMGSGTTGVACMNLGRKFIGVEIEEKYFDIAVERITNAQRQKRLFD